MRADVLSRGICKLRGARHKIYGAQMRFVRDGIILQALRAVRCESVQGVAS